MFLDHCWDCNTKLEKMCQVNLKSHQLGPGMEQFLSGSRHLDQLGI